MRGLWSTLALVVVLIGLGTYIYFVVWDQPADTGPKLEKLFQVEADQVQELRVKSSSGDVTSVKKEASGWQMVTPLTVKAADTEVLAITSALAQMEVTRVVDENPADLQEYGLTTPRIEVDFKMSDGKTSGRLVVGGKTPSGGDMYARRNDEKRVILVQAFQDTTLNRSTFDLRDKSLLGFDRDKVDGIDVRVGDRTLQMRRQGEEWKLASPVAAQADFAAVGSLIGRVQSAQIKSIVTEAATPADLKKYGLEQPQATVTINLGSARATLLLGGAADDTSVYARDASKPAIVTVETTLVDELKKGVDGYRRRDVFDFRPFNATRAELTRAGQTVVFEKVKGTGENAQDSWKRVAPTAASPEPATVDTLLATLADMRATSFTTSTAGTGLNTPALTVLIKFDEGKKEERISFGRRGENVYASLPAGDAGAALIDAQKFNDALKTLDELSK